MSNISHDVDIDFSDWWYWTTMPYGKTMLFDGVEIAVIHLNDQYFILADGILGFLRFTDEESTIFHLQKIFENGKLQYFINKWLLPTFVA